MARMIRTATTFRPKRSDVKEAPARKISAIVAKRKGKATTAPVVKKASQAARKTATRQAPKMTKKVISKNKTGGNVIGNAAALKLKEEKEFLKQ